MKGITSFRICLFLMWFIALLSIYLILHWVKSYNPPKYVGEVCSDEVKKAMNKMGPKYDYVMKGEKLYVDKGDGKLLRLKYERR